jgi:hypothetical protein
VPPKKKKVINMFAGHQLPSVILATQEAEIRRTAIRNQSRQISKKKKKNYKNRAGGVAQGVGPEFKP